MGWYYSGAKISSSYASKNYSMWLDNINSAFIYFNHTFIGKDVIITTEDGIQYIVSMEYDNFCHLMGVKHVTDNNIIMNLLKRGAITPSILPITDLLFSSGNSKTNKEDDILKPFLLKNKACKYLNMLTSTNTIISQYVGSGGNLRYDIALSTSKRLISLGFRLVGEDIDYYYVPVTLINITGESAKHPKKINSNNVRKVTSIVSIDKNSKVETLLYKRD